MLCNFVAFRETALNPHKPNRRSRRPLSRNPKNPFHPPKRTRRGATGSPQSSGWSKHKPTWKRTRTLTLAPTCKEGIDARTHENKYTRMLIHTCVHEQYYVQTQEDVKICEHVYCQALRDPISRPDSSGGARSSSPSYATRGSHARRVEVRAPATGSGMRRPHAVALRRRWQRHRTGFCAVASRKGGPQNARNLVRNSTHGHRLGTTWRPPIRFSGKSRAGGVVGQRAGLISL